MQNEPGTRCLAFVSKRRSKYAEKNFSELEAISPNIEAVELDTSNPLSVGDSIYSGIDKIAREDSLNDTIIDVTSFRREELLMLLSIIKGRNISENDNCEVGYLTAECMAEDWLSRNVISLHSVIGYAGEIWPSRNTTLVMMMGFEIERAQSIIDIYEPNQLILGKGGVSESISSELHQKNQFFFDNLRRQFNISEQNTFEFSLQDPLKTAQQLELVIPDNGENNIVLAPMNTKLSTTGAGIYALNHRNIQICYATVEEYNQEKFSKPGSDIYSINFSSILNAIR